MSVNAEIQGRPKHFYSIYSKIKTGRDFSTHLRPHRDPHHRGFRQGLLRGARRRARDVDAAAGALQRLHRDAQAQHVPVAAHDGRRSAGRAARDSDPHVGDAPHRRVRHRGALALQRRRQGRPVREQALLAARAARMAERHARLARVHGEPQARSLRLAGLRVFAARRRLLDARPAARRSTSPTQVHTDVGNHCVGAKVNGRIVPLDYQLQNGDICEILVNKSSGRPSLDWLSIVKTSSAKHKIKQWFRKERREENVLAGQEALEAGAGARAVCAPTSRAATLIERIATRTELRDADRSLRGDRVRRRLGASRRQPHARRSQGATTSSTSPSSRKPARVATRPRANRAACASPASTTCSCASRNAVRRCRAIRSSAT